MSHMLACSHQGGLRWQGGSKEQVWEQNSLFQKHSRVPLFIAANCDDGGNDVVPEGTFVATAAECGAGKGTENAYHLGLVAGREAAALGCNWLFNPVVDVYKNWRNTIVNTRSFGSDPDKVLENARAFIQGVREAAPHMACTIKHFPGDGVEERDQHLVMGVNDLSVDQWEKSFGKVYRTLIQEGIEAVMVGHIALPEMSRKLCPGIADREIKPASQAPELISDLLRKDMGFNGVVITDATHMTGFTAVAPRREAIPGGQAGCLFDNGYDSLPRLFYDQECWDRTIALWAEIAKRFGDRWIVGGYDLLNEPLCLPMDQEQIPKLGKFYDACIAAIRRIDQKHMFFLEPAGFARYTVIYDHDYDPGFHNWAIHWHRYGFCPEIKEIPLCSGSVTIPPCRLGKVKLLVKQGVAQIHKLHFVTDQQ